MCEARRVGECLNEDGTLNFATAKAPPVGVPMHADDLPAWGEVRLHLHWSAQNIDA